MQKIWSFLKRNFPSAILGAIIGAVISAPLGYIVSQVQQDRTELVTHNKELTARIDAAIREIQVNDYWGTNSPAYTNRDDSLPIKRYYSTDALVALTNELPSLLPGDTLIYYSTTTLLGIIYSLNQLIKQHNLIVLNPLYPDSTLKILDSLILVLEDVNATLCINHVDSLRTRLPD